MNSTSMDSSHQLLVQYYQEQWYTLILDFVLKCFIGTMQSVLTYATLLASIKMFFLIYRQWKYDNYKEKWLKEIALYEDEGVIQETNEKYKKLMTKYYDRLEKYDKRHLRSLNTYFFMFLLIIFFNGVWIYIPYTRICYGYGVILFILYHVVYVFYQVFLKQYLAERTLQKERDRLDREIAKNKKQN